MEILSDSDDFGDLVNFLKSVECQWPANHACFCCQYVYELQCLPERQLITYSYVNR